MTGPVTSLAPWHSLMGLPINSPAILRGLLEEPEGGREMPTTCAWGRLLDRFKACDWEKIVGTARVESDFILTGRPHTQKVEGLDVHPAVEEAWPTVPPSHFQFRFGVFTSEKDVSVALTGIKNSGRSTARALVDALASNGSLDWKATLSSDIATWETAVLESLRRRFLGDFLGAERAKNGWDPVPFEVFARGLVTFDWKKSLEQILPFKKCPTGVAWTFAFKGDLSRRGVGGVDFTPQVDLFHRGYFRVELEVKREPEGLLLRMVRASGNGSRLVVRALEHAWDGIVNDVDFPPRQPKPDPESATAFSSEEKEVMEREYREFLLCLPYWYDVFRPMKREFGSESMLIDALTEAFAVAAEALARNPEADPRTIIENHLRRLISHRYKEVSCETLPTWKRRM